MIKNNIFLLFLLLFILSCKQTAKKDLHLSSLEINKVVSKMTDVMVHDITNPPLAARFFAYSCLAGYEVVSQQNSSYKTLQGVLNGYKNVEKWKENKEIDQHLTVVLAMLETAKKMQPSGKALLGDYAQKMLDSCQNIGFSKQIIQNSQEYASHISQQILAYAKADKYNQISNFPRYAPTEKEGTWYPTPPGYLAAVEPYFNTIRPFLLDSAAQFKPKPPIAFSKDKKSGFYKLMNELYLQKNGKKEQEIAAFWDCNPFALQDNGHLMVGMKKISPPAHWMGITGIACAKSNANFEKTMQIHAILAIGMTDAFISCWDEKYRSNRIRPETAIRKYIDPNWKPFLQTPPFPEYLSGHSTVSATAATILTHFLGDNFKYEDNVEERFGLPKRSFSSFHQAAEEAGISRFYGGIHFMDAIENGKKQGKLVGNWTNSQIE